MKFKLYGVGVWEDEDGVLHVDIPIILSHCHIEDTPENRDRVAGMAVRLLKENGASKVEVQ
jgi:hypothetical protein